MADDKTDATRWRTLMRHFKVDHIWCNVLGSPDRFNTVEEAIDAVTKADTWEVLHTWSHKEE